MWQARISLVDGKRKYFYGRTRQEVARNLAEATRDRDRGLPVVLDERLTAGAYLAQWLEQMRPPRVRDSTHLRYSQLLADGMPLHKVSALLGHASISITADLYGHLAQSDYQRETRASMERLFGERECDEAGGAG